MSMARAHGHTFPLSVECCALREQMPTSIAPATSAEVMQIISDPVRTLSSTQMLSMNAPVCRLAQWWLWRSCWRLQRLRLSRD